MAPDYSLLGTQPVVLGPVDEELLRPPKPPPGQCFRVSGVIAGGAQGLMEC